jgi:hypothetical protein
MQRLRNQASESRCAGQLFIRRREYGPTCRCTPEIAQLLAAFLALPCRGEGPAGRAGK